MGRGPHSSRTSTARDPRLRSGREHDLPALVEPESGLTDGGNLDRIGIVVLGALGLQATYTGPLDEDARILRGLERVALDAYRAQRGATALDGVEIELDGKGRIRSLRA